MDAGAFGQSQEFGIPGPVGGRRTQIRKRPRRLGPVLALLAYPVGAVKSIEILFGRALHGTRIESIIGRVHHVDLSARIQRKARYGS